MAILRAGLEIGGRKLKRVAKEGEVLMRNLAPYNTGATRGKGSYATGRLKGRIHVEKVNQFAYLITPGNVTDERGRRYAKYAENGNSLGMVGWKFAEQTRDILQRKYGG